MFTIHTLSGASCVSYRAHHNDFRLYNCISVNVHGQFQPEPTRPTVSLRLHVSKSCISVSIIIIIIIIIIMVYL
jgi:hypothetical protein